MKKCIAALTALILLLALSGCRAAPLTQETPPAPLEAGEDQTLRRVKVMEVNDSTVLAVGWDDGERPLELCFMGLSNTQVLDAEGNAVTAAGLRPGMVLDVVLYGSIRETWPCQISADAVQVAEQGDDLVGLYRQVINDLWEEDPGLNGGAELLGFDLSTLTNLTDGEREALEYLASCDLGLGLSYVSGTWQELCEQGYIDGENLYWENGVFLSLELTETGEDSFVFTAEKWRSGLGAIWFMDCTAARGSDGQWSYEPGVFAIS